MLIFYKHPRFDSRKQNPQEVVVSLAELLTEEIGKRGIEGSTSTTLRAGRAALGADHPAVRRLETATARLALEEPDSKPDEWYDEEIDAENALFDAIVEGGERAVRDACNEISEEVFEVVQ